MLRSRGFSLIEVLIALCISSVALVAFFGAFSQFQAVNHDLSALHERNSNLSMAPLLLLKWMAGAGNNRWDQGWEGVSTDGRTVGALSDSEGPGGFPDQALNDTYEMIWVRDNGKDLQIKSKSGSYQPAVKNIARFEVDSDPPSLKFRLEGATDSNLLTSRTAVESKLDLEVYLWNYRPNLFAEAP